MTILNLERNRTIEWGDMKDQNDYFIVNESMYVIYSSGRSNTDLHLRINNKKRILTANIDISHCRIRNRRQLLAQLISFIIMIISNGENKKRRTTRRAIESPSVQVSSRERVTPLWS
jgi:hypothetical protein